MVGVFENCLMYLETLRVFDKPFGVFGNWLGVFRKPLSVFGKTKFPNTLRHFQIHSTSVFGRPNKGWTTTDDTPLRLRKRSSQFAKISH